MLAPALSPTPPPHIYFLSVNHENEPLVPRKQTSFINSESTSDFVNRIAGGNLSDMQLGKYEVYHCSRIQTQITFVYEGLPSATQEARLKADVASFIENEEMLVCLEPDDPMPWLPPYDTLVVKEPGRLHTPMCLHLLTVSSVPERIRSMSPEGEPQPHPVIDDVNGELCISYRSPGLAI